jgi:hypothetical protein
MPHCFASTIKSSTYSFAELRNQFQLQPRKLMIREIIVMLKVCGWGFAAMVMTFRRSFFAVSCPFLGGVGGDYRLALKK